MLDRALTPTTKSTLRRTDGASVDWAVSTAPVAYLDAVAAMEARAAAIAAGDTGELIWLLEHPPLYTAGVSSKDGDLLDAARFPVHRSGRGGQFTYHGPGQRVAYVMLDLNQRGKDVRTFVRGLEQWIIGALGEFGVPADVREGRVGVWVVPDNRSAASGMTSSGAVREAKIAAIGVKVRKWVSFHGISLMWSRIWSISLASCRAASPSMASPAWSTSACPRRWTRRTRR